MELSHGSRVAVVGGGPAGSFVALFIKKFSRLLRIDLQVDIYEPKDFSQAGAKGCNHCGGILSESLIQFMATEGIDLPADIVMNAIDSYCFHTDTGHVHLQTPLEEMRIAAVFRGGGPKSTAPALQEQKKPVVRSFDKTILDLACAYGAQHIKERVTKLSWQAGLPAVTTATGQFATYELLVGAVGVNGTGIKLFESLGIGYRPPRESKTFVTDYYLGETVVGEYVGNTMHVFILDIPGIKQGAIIPKGPYVTICYVAEQVSNELTERFFAHPEVKACFPADWRRPSGRESCLCIPMTNIADPVNYYTDRVVMIGDCGVARLFKNGIGSAYVTAKACATTVVLQGIAKTDFDRYFKPTCNRISFDNRLGHFILGLLGWARRWHFFRYAILTTAAAEQSMPASQRIMSMALWDSFSGSAPYTHVLLRTIRSPGFLIRFMWAFTKGVFGARHAAPRKP